MLYIDKLKGICSYCQERYRNQHVAELRQKEDRGHDTHPLSWNCCNWYAVTLSPAELLERARAEGCDFGAVTNIVSARAFRIGGVFSSETGKEGNAWNVVVY
jgi:hypothetical protein